jgi:hypothetical protein
LALAAILLIYVIRLLREDLVPYFGSWTVQTTSQTKESWKKEFQALAPDFQATLLKRTTPQDLNLKIDAFLELLHEVEKDVREDPAASVYWSKRQQIEQIIRQERIG